jgi:PAS domain S-box-containing protein
VDEAHFRELCDYLGFDAAQVRVLSRVLGAVEPVFPKIVDEFYAVILAHPGTRRILRSESQVGALRKSFLEWMRSFFHDARDGAYLERRNRIGKVHVQIGLAQVYVFSAMGLVRDRLAVAAARLPDARERQAYLAALHRGLDVELAILADGYMEADKYRDLIENAPEMIHSVDREGRFLLVNGTEQRLLGYTLGEFQGLRIDDIVPEPRRWEVRAHIARVFEKGFSHVETQFVAKDGRILDVEIHATGQHDRVTDRIVATRAYVRDLTERNKLQQTLIAKERLSAIGSMAVTLAHEIRNPLAGLSGALQVLERAAAAQGQDTGIYAELQGQIQRLNRLVEDLLQYGRPFALRRQKTALGDLVTRTFDLLKEGKDFRNVALDLRGSALEIPVMADPSVLQQAFLNLFLNSAHAMGGSGTIRAGIEREGDALRVTIRDTGPGISSEAAGRLFTPFFTTKPQGTGLGLSICRRIVEAHGGRIDVKRDGTPGAEFHIFLPLEAA